jgi:hypothetical protein
MGRSQLHSKRANTVDLEIAQLASNPFVGQDRRTPKTRKLILVALEDELADRVARSQRCDLILRQPD